MGHAVEWHIYAASRLPRIQRFRAKLVKKDVADYFAAIPENRKARINELHSLIISLYPDAVVDLKYKMPTYRVGEGWVALANQKNYISLYTCGYHHIEVFSKNNPEIKTGKGCINFRDKDRLAHRDIKAVVRHAIDHPKDIAP